MDRRLATAADFVHVDAVLLRRIYALIVTVGIIVSYLVALIILKAAPPSAGCLRSWLRPGSR